MDKQLGHLVETAASTPSAGMWKPEPLTGSLAGCWSRPVDEQLRLIYRVTDKDMIAGSCRYQYRYRTNLFLYVVAG
ncbi:type II toxin-antitoxin system YoeB family toxin [Massilia solisilvae]|uniref:type II toxin-antitoxin system YoeB family toxin n=1 Tax=Massilia solisilvae TaxID=1811225 RepID=UPI00351D4194